MRCWMPLKLICPPLSLLIVGKAEVKMIFRLILLIGRECKLSWNRDTLRPYRSLKIKCLLIIDFSGHEQKEMETSGLNRGKCLVLILTLLNLMWRGYVIVVYGSFVHIQLNISCMSFVCVSRGDCVTCCLLCHLCDDVKCICVLKPKTNFHLWTIKWLNLTMNVGNRK